MNQYSAFRPRLIAATLAQALLSFGVQAASTDLADVPMAVKTLSKANVLIVLDNSQSMDGYMSGTLVSGNDANTRGNIGRTILRNVINANQGLNWGLMSFDTTGTSLQNTYVYYMGDNTSMVFTDDCVSGISATNGNKPCVANPQPFTGGNYVTYWKSSDDQNILDVLYTTGTYNQLWALSPSGAAVGDTRYDVYKSHNTVNDWSAGQFSNKQGTWSFTPTDAGFLPSYPTVTQQLYLPRGQGYIASITGGGKLFEAIKVSTDTTHFNNLLGYLANETLNTGSSEIKNSAVFTPLVGTMKSAKNYFAGQTDWKSSATYTSPITSYCQNNFAILVTDGLPTGDTSGNLYSDAARTDTCSAWSATTPSTCTGTWTFGQAAQDTFSAITALRTTPYTGCTSCTNFDIQTYVIAMGASATNPRAVAIMNQMATLGGAWPTPFFATDSASLTSSLTSVVQDIVTRDGSAAAVAVSNANVTSGDNSSYASEYNSGNWTGDLKAYPIDLTTGVPDTTSPIWSTSAQAQLDLRSPSSRYIATYSGTSGSGQGIPFQPAGCGGSTCLSTTQQALLNTPYSNPGTSDGADVVNYLRGTRSGESTGTYRVRAHLLGDIVNSEPLIVREPLASYADTCYKTAAAASGCATSYKASQASRTKVVVQGANDGMLHIFNAATGAEAWAYIPNILLNTSDPNYSSTSTLNMLTRASGYNHRYYVDGTPVAGDVDFNNTNGASGNPDWHTIVVGGLGKGGRGYYALDLTTTTATSESDAAAKVLWEFPNSDTDTTLAKNIGYTYGKPIITKTAAYGWVVLVTSGYNNGSDTGGTGHGYLWVLNAKTGAVLQTIDTGVGSSSNPSGLAQIAGYTDNGNIDNTTTYAYGGDLLGNVWRFDLTDHTGQIVYTVQRLATLRSGSTTSSPTQPITSTPELALITIGGTGKRFVYVGTGAYLGQSDVDTNQTQTIYGLIDDLSTPSGSDVIADPVRSLLQVQTLTTSGTTRTATANTVDFTTKKGWYIDLPACSVTSGGSCSKGSERVNTDPVVVQGELIVTSNVPNSTDPCSPGGSSYVNIIDYQTGGQVSGATWASQSLGNALASRPVPIKLPNGQVKVEIRGSDAQTRTTSVPTPSGTSLPKRVTWQEISQ